MIAKSLVVGSAISCTTVDEVATAIVSRDAQQVAICTVHSVMTARANGALRSALEGADIATPDGVPLTWTLRLTGHPGQVRVDGYSVFKSTVERGLSSACRHFFYGSNEMTLMRLTSRLVSNYPDIVVAGSYAPPYRPFGVADVAPDLDRIRLSKPDVIWVGLGMPKQELWMQEASRHTHVPIVAIGAVFDWYAGNQKKAPTWMQRAGLEWLYRLAHEPRRLWSRYIWNNPAYMVLMMRQILSYQLGRVLRVNDRSLGSD